MKKIFILIPLFAFNLALAQDSLQKQWNNLAVEKPFLKHDIAFKLGLIDTVNLGDSNIEYFNKNRKFKDVYSAKKVQGFTISSERFVTIKDWKIYGRFSFSKYEEKGGGYTEMANPYRDNPYKIADSITNADWKKQYYLIETKIVSPEIVKRLKAGLGIKYEVLNGARQIDPRPLDKLINLTVTPQLIYSLNNWMLGINGNYNWFREDLSISLENFQQSKNIYKTLGLGEYLYNGPIILSGGLSRFYEGNTYGGGLSIAKTINNNHFVQVSGSYNTIKETATDGSSIPFNAGEHNRNELRGIVTYQYRTNQSNHTFSLEGNHSKANNTEFIQTLNSTTQQYNVLYSSIMNRRQKNSISFDYQLQILKENKFPDWNFALTGIYENLEDKYPSTKSKLILNNYTFSGLAKKWFQIKGLNLAIGLKSTYKVIGNNQLNYIPNVTSTNFIATNIMYPNYYFDTTSYWANEANLQVTFPTFKNKGAQLYIKLNYQNINSVDSQIYYPKGLTNNYFNFTIGLYN